ncbi:L-threonylcarbamoyladenylate synthase [Methylocystis echinoides]|uniref:Threonylcarbamoyl-AMP synthase n=1 Tax=Methylocystis echinoides TaxID=29468 RepID=A0A9W6LRE8_9HYPH|nr:L-threonylcarbamoyladenylate synthase [Methylocystis echinoides]GLI92377.1 threonylcarbamoyl-AMP synthase [Methylocystis echinoides]
MTILAQADAAAITRAADVLRSGGLVAFPTETVYGLGADATSGWAVARIYDAKGRPSFNPLIAHVADLPAAQREAALPEAATRLAEAFWPGPLTIVAPAAPGGSVSELARAGLPSVALRIPDHPVARALIAALGRPVAAPSANRSGHVSPVTAAHVAEDLSGRVDMILDGGRATAGLESTIVSFCEATPTLLRPGAIAREKIEKVLGAKLAAPARAEVLAPGMTASHYAPNARLRLEAHELREGEAALDFGGRLTALAPPGAVTLDLSPQGDLVEAAANLFSHLRALDARHVESIAVAHIPERGLGEAINDRLRRAAAPRV